MASQRRNIKCQIVKELSFDDSDSDVSFTIRKEGNVSVVHNGEINGDIFESPSIDESSSDCSGSIGEGSSTGSLCSHSDNDTDEYDTDDDDEDDEIQNPKQKLSITEALKSMFVGYSKDKKEKYRKATFHHIASSEKSDCRNVDDLTQETNSIETLSTKLQSPLPLSDHSLSDSSVIDIHEGHSDQDDSLEENSDASYLGDNDTLESSSLIEDLLDYDSNDEELDNKSVASCTDDSISLGTLSQGTYSEGSDSKGTLSDMESLDDESIQLDQKAIPTDTQSSYSDIEENGHEVTFQDLKLEIEDVDKLHESSLSPEVATGNEKEGDDRNRLEETNEKGKFHRLKRSVIGHFISQREKFTISRIKKQNSKS